MTTDTDKIDPTEAAWRDLFFRACVALWGERWQAAAAKEFWINERTIRRIVAGAPVPTFMFDRLQRLMDDRGGELRVIDQALSSLMAGDEPARKTEKTPEINVELIRERLEANLAANGNPDMAEFLLRVLGHDQLANDVARVMGDYRYYRRKADEEEEAYVARHGDVMSFLGGPREPPTENDKLMDEAREAMFVLFREVRIVLDISADRL